MFKILIDTCVWLDLAKDYQGAERPWGSGDTRPGEASFDHLA